MHFPLSPAYPHFGGVRRDLDAAINEPLITKFRIVFLEVLRKCYHRHVQQGRLPRGSQAALALLNSIDIGMETVHTDGLQDWDAVQNSLKGIDRWTTWNAHLRTFCGRYCHCQEGSFVLTLLLENQSVRDADKIYILTSFIDAHSYAQQHIPYYLGEEVGISTPEEALMVKESAASVAEARAILEEIEEEILSLHTTRQAACMVLRCECGWGGVGGLVVFAVSDLRHVVYFSSLITHRPSRIAPSLF